MMDIKGDFSGIAKEGELKSFITERHQKIDIPFSVSNYPVELMSLSDEQGVRPEQGRGLRRGRRLPRQSQRPQAV